MYMLQQLLNCFLKKNNYVTCLLWSIIQTQTTLLAAINTTFLNGVGVFWYVVMLHCVIQVQLSRDVVNGWETTHLTLQWVREMDEYAISIGTQTG